MSIAHGIVYIVDDEAEMRKALCRLLKAEGFDPRAFATAREFLDAFRSEETACLVLDVAMPELDGLELQRRLTHLGLIVPIVFVTGRGDIPMSVSAIKSGAMDFLTKPVRDVDLLRAIRAGLELASTRKKEQAMTSALAERYARLTPRERDVMAQVVEGRLNKQIAAELGTGEQNIKIHRGRVMRKMGVESLADLVRVAERLGVAKSSVA